MRGEFTVPRRGQGPIRLTGELPTMRVYQRERYVLAADWMSTDARATNQRGADRRGARARRISNEPISALGARASDGRGQDGGIANDAEKRNGKSFTIGTSKRTDLHLLHFHPEFELLTTFHHDS